MMQSLTNRNILLICPTFFGYEKEIYKGLLSLGATVYAFDERPKNTFLTKALVRLNQHKLIKKKIRAHYKYILNSVKDKVIDTILIISPETMNKRILLQLKEQHPQAKCIIYLWDSVDNRPNAKKLLPCVDSFFSFDAQDAKQYEKMKFLPLFYIKDYGNIINSSNKYKYEISFIGTIHSDRYQLVHKIFNQVPGNKFAYFYCPNPLVFIFRKYITKELQGVDGKSISYKPLSKSQVINIIQNSKSVIDIQHPNQHGLTMRTIEMLGAKKKLISTNHDIASYDFYDENNISIIDRNTAILDTNFLQKKNKEITNDIYLKYSLENWLHSLLSGPKE